MRFIFILLFCISQQGFSKDVVCLEKTEVELSQRKAILVLPGFGGNSKRIRGMKKVMRDKGYDLFIPDYKDRKSLEGSVKKLLDFSEKWNLKEYKELNVYAFIVGTWTLNLALREETFLPNITSVVYDRGPIQERVPAHMIKSKKRIYKMVVGEVLEDFANTGYPPNSRKNVRVGILLETGVCGIL